MGKIGGPLRSFHSPSRGESSPVSRKSASVHADSSNSGRGLGNSPIAGRLEGCDSEEAVVKRKRTDLGVEGKRLKKMVRGLKTEVNRWRDYALSNLRTIRKSIEAADREYGKKGGISLESVIRRLELRRKIPREVRMEFLRKSGKEIRAQLKKRRLTEGKILAEFEAWRKARRGGQGKK